MVEGSSPTRNNATIVVRGLIVDHRTDSGTLRALDCTHLLVPAGTSLAIMGPSGCGKSTLLGVIAGLSVPTSGRVTIGDVVMSDLPEPQRVVFRRRELGMVYQADNLLPHLTVEENVGLQLAISRRGRHDGGASVASVLGRLGVGGLGQRLPDQLSGGQRQRVAIARAIIHRPSVILADEPTGSLDPAVAHTVVELLTEVQRDAGASLLMATHDPAMADHLDDIARLATPGQVTSS